MGAEEILLRKSHGGPYPAVLPPIEVIRNPLFCVGAIPASGETKLGFNGRVNLGGVHGRGKYSNRVKIGLDMVENAT